MSDIQFYNVPLTGRASAGSRVVRRLALPFFTKLTTILETIVERLNAMDGKIEELSSGDLGMLLTANNDKLNKINHKLDRINQKFDMLNLKFDRLNNKFDEINGGFKALISRQGEVEEKAAAVTSLHWDHVAVSRRLAQLEDRLLDAAEDLKLDTATDNGSEDTEVKTLFLFPGLDRFEKGKAI